MAEVIAELVIKTVIPTKARGQKALKKIGFEASPGTTFLGFRHSIGWVNIGEVLYG